MKTINFSTSACRSCRYYRTEGRRGGLCQQLGVPVRGSWGACSLAVPPFAPSWENLEAIAIWTDKTLTVQDAISSIRVSDFSQADTVEEQTASSYKKLAANTLV